MFQQTLQASLKPNATVDIFSIQGKEKNMPILLSDN